MEAVAGEADPNIAFRSVKARDDGTMVSVEIVWDMQGCGFCVSH